MAQMGPTWGPTKIYRQSKQKSMLAVHKLQLTKQMVRTISGDSSVAAFILLLSWQDSGRAECLDCNSSAKSVSFGHLFERLR
jgi:hypothetical protein